MLTVHDLTYRYARSSPEVLKGVDISLSDGEIGILLGKNGSGKTTLITNILGINRPTGGNVLLDERDLLRMSPKERARLVAYVPQVIRFGELTVFDSVLLGRVARFGAKAGQEDYAAVEKILREMGLTSFAQRNAERLSGGEKQKIAIARALAQEPKLLVFDEPTGNLDIAAEQLIIAEAKKLACEKGITVLSSLHDLNSAMYFGDRFFFLKDGRVKYTGGREIFTEDVIRDVFGAEVLVREIDGKKVILGGYCK